MSKVESQTFHLSFNSSHKQVDAKKKKIQKKWIECRFVRLRRKKEFRIEWKKDAIHQSDYFNHPLCSLFASCIFFSLSTLKKFFFHSREEMQLILNGRGDEKVEKNNINQHYFIDYVRSSTVDCNYQELFDVFHSILQCHVCFYCWWNCGW